MGKEAQILPEATTDRIDNILDQIVLKFLLEQESNGFKASICLPFAFDTGLSLLNLPGLTEQDYREYLATVIDMFPEPDYMTIVMAYELMAIFQILKSKGLNGSHNLVDLYAEDNFLLTDFDPTEKQQILIIPTKEQRSLHAVSFAGRLPDGRIIVFDLHSAFTNQEINIRGVNIYSIDELTQLIQQSSRPGYLITIKPEL